MQLTNNHPEVLILLAAYNGKRFIREQIDSIINQDYENWKLILSDDGEKTSDILDEYATRCPKRIVHYRSGQRFGSATAHFMHLLKQFGSSAPYVMFSDQDDVWNKDKIQKTLSAMRSTERTFDGPILVHTDLRVVDSSLEEISPSFFSFAHLPKRHYAPSHLLVQCNNVSGCTAMLNRELTKLSVRKNIDNRIFSHDNWVSLVATFFGKIVFVDEPTILYRQHTNNSCGAKSLFSLTYILAAFHRATYRQFSRQAEAFLDCYGDMLTEKDSELLRAVVSLGKSNKAKRILTYFRFGLWKAPFLRQIGQLVFW